jgi:hypothetical protein
MHARIADPVPRAAYSFDALGAACAHVCNLVVADPDRGHSTGNKTWMMLNV